LNPEAIAQLRKGLGVDLGDNPLACVIGGDSRDLRRDGAARAAALIADLL